MSNNITVQTNPINLTIGFQNIEGLHSDCECFLPEITENVKNDIHFLAETWTCGHDKELTGIKIFLKMATKTLGLYTVGHPVECFYISRKIYLNT